MSELQFLQPYVSVILDEVATLTGIPGIRDAFVTDETYLDHFLVRKSSGEKYSDTEYNFLIAELGDRLGVPLDPNDPESLRLPVVARKLKNL